MSYVPPAVTSAGLSIPSYKDFLDYLTGQFQSIFGTSVYLGNDSSDFQEISVRALALSDAVQGLQLAYTNRAPATAIGAAQDSLYKLNGIARKVPSFSTCTVTLSGLPNTVINNGIITDPIFGFKWDLPPLVQLNSGGSVVTSVTCETPGAVLIPPSSFGPSSIATPTAGWNNVSNAAASAPGQPTESDSQFRARQAISTELPANTTLAATIAAVAAVPGVTRYNVAENFTNATDVNGNPAHSVTAVVEGGTDNAVAFSIFSKRGIGPLTNGTTTVNISDPITQEVTAISFDRPTYKPIFIAITVHQLAGYTTGVTSAIVTALVDYLNSLQIGENLTISGLYGAALSVMPNLSLPLFSITTLLAGLSIGSEAGTDITIAFNQVTQGVMGNIVVTLT